MIESIGNKTLNQEISEQPVLAGAIESIGNKLPYIKGQYLQSVHKHIQNLKDNPINHEVSQLLGKLHMQIGEIIDLGISGKRDKNLITMQAANDEDFPQKLAA